MLSASFVLPFSSRALFLFFFFFFFFFRCITDVLLARRVFFHPPSVCVCVLYITARALERVKMRLKIIQTDDEIVRLVNVYFETVWDTPVPFQIESFFVFSFFCFFLFPFERYGIALQSSGTQQREREREREQKNKKLPFFHSFCFEEANIYFEGNEFFSSLELKNALNLVKFVAGKDH